MNKKNMLFYVLLFQSAHVISLQAAFPAWFNITTAGVIVNLASTLRQMRVGESWVGVDEQAELNNKHTQEQIVFSWMQTISHFDNLCKENAYYKGLSVYERHMAIQLMLIFGPKMNTIMSMR